MKLPIDLKGVSPLKIFKKNFSIVLWVFLGIILVLTGLVIFKEVRKVTQVQTNPEGALDRIVRVNLTQHQALEKLLGDNSSFEPQPVPGANAFGSAPAKAP